MTRSGGFFIADTTAPSRGRSVITAAIHRLPISLHMFFGMQRSLAQRRGLSAEMIMSKQNNGGPAFPHSARLVAPDTYEHLTHGGMSLRDYFAAKAMLAIGVTYHDDQHAEIAETAYKMADAMLRARESL